MTVRGTPELTELSKLRAEQLAMMPHRMAAGAAAPRDFTRVSFVPDLRRFGTTQLSDDMVALLQRRVVEAAMLGAPAQVFLNGSLVKVDGMHGFMRKYIGSPSRTGPPSQGASAAPMPEISRREQELAMPVARLGERWQVGVALSPHDDFAHVSFANGVSTPRGGTHVDHVASAVLEKVLPKLAKKLKLKTNVWLTALAPPQPPRSCGARMSAARHCAQRRHASS